MVAVTSFEASVALGLIDSCQSSLFWLAADAVEQVVVVSQH